MSDTSIRLDLGATRQWVFLAGRLKCDLPRSSEGEIWRRADGNAAQRDDSEM